MTDIDPDLAALGPPGSWAASASGPAGSRSSSCGRRSWTPRASPSGSRSTGVSWRALTGAGAAPEPVARRGAERRLTVRPDELAVLEFDLAGVASDGRDWLAFAYSPTGQLHAYRRRRPPGRRDRAAESSPPTWRWRRAEGRCASRSPRRRASRARPRDPDTKKDPEAEAPGSLRIWAFRPAHHGVRLD